MPPVHNYDQFLQEDVQWGVDTGTKKNPGGGILSGTKVGLHSLAQGQAKTSAVWAVGVVAPLGTITMTVLVPGAVLGDFAMAAIGNPAGGQSTGPQGLLPFAVVSDAGVVTVTLFNPSTSAITIAATLVHVLVLKAR